MDSNTTNTTESSLLENISEVTTKIIGSSTTLRPTLPSTSFTDHELPTIHIETTSPSSEASSSGIWLMTMVIFIVAVALIVKIIISNRKKSSELIGGTARWRLAASQQSGAGPARTAASYAPMGNRSGLEGPSQERALDWERQFFDEAAEPTEPSMLQLDINRV